jgi:hypothetical protein
VSWKVKTGSQKGNKSSALEGEEIIRVASTSRIIKLRQPELLNAQKMPYGWKKYRRNERYF